MNDIDLQFVKYRDLIYKVILYNVNYQKELAEDLTQELYIKIKDQVARGKYQEMGKFKAWALWVARNLVVDYHRKENRSGIFMITDEKYDFLFELNADPEPAIEETIINEEEAKWLSDVVEDALKYMDPEIRRVFVKRVFENKSFRKIVEEDHYSINTELGRMRYAKRTIINRINELKIA